MKPHPTDEKIRQCITALLNGLQPPPDLTISEWADQNRIIPPQGASEPGQWRTSRTPYLREIMDELSPFSHTEEVVVMKGSQIGYTECLINTVLYYMSHDPCPILFVEPTIDVIKRVSRLRLQPSIDVCKELKNKIVSNKSRAGGNTILQKDFVGGALMMGGANSAAGLRSMSIRLLLLDELDAYPADVDGEGDPVNLAVKRTTNFPRRKIAYGSSPTIADYSNIERKFLSSDQRYYYVPCPKCEEYQIIHWENIKYVDRDPATVYLECEKCNWKISENNKTRMLVEGKWIKHNPVSKIAGFHISALYSPLGWYSWEDAVTDHLKAIGNAEERKVWVNTVLAETWDESVTTIDCDLIKKREERYPSDVPNGVLVLTTGGDVQDDRIEVSTWGWGIRGERWLIDHSVFRGDLSQPTIWCLVDLHLLRAWAHENGSIIYTAATCIDAMGHYTDEVYAFCRARMHRRVFPIQGRSGQGRQIVGKATKNKRGNVYLFQVGVDQAKESIYSSLKIQDVGPGYTHFPAQLPTFTSEKRYLTGDFYKQLTAEKRLTRHTAGLPRLEWVLPSGKRNEALDCGVYALAALQILNPNLELMASEQRVFSSDYRAVNKRPVRRIISQGVTV
jgi:phage terminase large subunit GpA-like protein